MDTDTMARWMIANGFATGHGDSVEDLLRQLAWQVQELRSRKLCQCPPTTIKKGE